MRKPPPLAWLTILCLLLGVGLRFSGLTRGSASLALSGQPGGDTAAFYHFNPDEETVIRAALRPDFDLLDPPFTAYGVLPAYALRGALALANLCGWGGTSLEDPDSARHLYYIARTLAVLCSCGILLLVWRIGCLYFDRPAAVLGLAIVAFAPGAIQQAHFFIVDGFFVLLSVAAVHAALQATERGDRRWYALCGALVGATAAVRLNGLLLGLVLLAGHLARSGEEGRGMKPLGQRLRQPELWLAGGMALLVLLLIEPFLLINPGLLWLADEPKDFSHAIQIASGQILQPWTLVDVHTVPYLDHWRLWPLVTGWPCTVLFLLATAYVLWKEKTLPRVLMLAWCGLYFLPIGQLQTRAVRYLMPMLPFLALFAGALLAASWRAARPWIRQGGKLVTALVVGHLAFSGLAFARIYLEEDSRIQAGRWIAAQIPRGSKIGVENGAFSMQGFVSGQGYPQVMLGVSQIFYTYPYMSCRAQMTFLEARLQEMDYLALTDVNRHAQFAEVPELFPVVAGLYERLIAGELGFELVQRFKTYPSLLGFSFADDGAEPSFLGYDHPTVWIFKSKGKTVLSEAFARWESQIAENPCCPDLSLEQVAEQFRAGDWGQAKSAVHSLLATYPDLALGYRLLAEVHHQLGAPDSATGALIRYQLPAWTSAPAAVAVDSFDAALGRYQPENPRITHVLYKGTIHSIPAATALSFAGLGLEALALQVLAEAVDKKPQYSSQAADQMAHFYLEVAKRFFVAGDLTRMEQTVVLSTRIFGIKEAYNILATRAHQRSEPQQALKWWEQSLLIDPNQADIHRRAGLVALLELGQSDKARYHFAWALQLDPALEAQITAELKAARENR